MLAHPDYGPEGYSSKPWCFLEHSLGRELAFMDAGQGSKVLGICAMVKWSYSGFCLVKSESFDLKSMLPNTDEVLGSDAVEWFFRKWVRETLSVLVESWNRTSISRLSKTGSSRRRQDSWICQENWRPKSWQWSSETFMTWRNWLKRSEPKSQWTLAETMWSTTRSIWRGYHK